MQMCSHEIRSNLIFVYLIIITKIFVFIMKTYKLSINYILSDATCSRVTLRALEYNNTRHQFTRKP